jgi:hypothetical protein
MKWNFVNFIREEEAKVLHDWIEKGVFEAFEHQYLSEVVFGVYADESNSSNLIESYNCSLFLSFSPYLVRIKYGKDLELTYGLNGTSSQVGVPQKYTKAQVQKVL